MLQKLVVPVVLICHCDIISPFVSYCRVQHLACHCLTLFMYNTGTRYEGRESPRCGWLTVESSNLILRALIRLEPTAPWEITPSLSIQIGY